MIVADSNVAAYYWINGPLTNVAQQVWLRDPEWHVPLLWRSEMRGILTGYLRDGTLTARQIAQFMAGAVGAFSDREHLVSSEIVFKITERTRLSTYDSEFVALAKVLGVPLVTAVKLVLNAFPDRAQTMQDFVAR